MKKFLIIFVGILLCFQFGAYSGILSNNEQNMCYFVDTPTEVNAVFEPKQYTCANGDFLPLNHEGCEPCPTGHVCSGGNFAFNEDLSQGISYSIPLAANINYGCDKGLLFPINNSTEIFAVFEPKSITCSVGQYLPANSLGCITCPLNNACVGGTYSFNETTDQGIQSCASGTFAPSGSAVCYQHILHVGDDIVYLRDTKLTTPSLNIQIGENIFYANMTTTPTYMNKDSSHYLHILYEGEDYYVCDDTTYGE